MIYTTIEIIAPTLTKHLPMHPDRRNGIALRQSTFTAFAAAKAGERARQQFPKFVKAKGSDGLLQTNAITETYWQWRKQRSSDRTHELDFHPFKEVF
jgi:hypothetical protein